MYPADSCLRAHGGAQVLWMQIVTVILCIYLYGQQVSSSRAQASLLQAHGVQEQDHPYRPSPLETNAHTHAHAQTHAQSHTPPAGDATRHRWTQQSVCPYIVWVNVTTAHRMYRLRGCPVPTVLCSSPVGTSVSERPPGQYDVSCRGARHLPGTAMAESHSIPSLVPYSPLPSLSSQGISQLETLQISQRRRVLPRGPSTPSMQVRRAVQDTQCHFLPSAYLSTRA